MNNGKIQTHYGDQLVEMELPQGWQLLGNLRTQYFPPIAREEMVKALENPIGRPRLEEIAKGKKKPVIIASDITRPVQGEVALPLVLNILNRTGIPDKDILLIMGGGSHVQPKDFRQACIKKYGQEVVDRVKIAYHNADQDVVPLGKTRRGHTIEVNRQVAEADLRIGFGGIIPHGFGGYGGGAKCILPGVVSRETMIQNHTMVEDPGVGMGLVEGNPIREEMEEVADRVGLDFLFNLVLNSEGEPVGAVSGDFRQAYRKGVAQARHIFEAPLTRPAQIMFTSGHPFDIHLYQSFNGPCCVMNACADGGTIVLLTPAHEGIRSGTKKLFSSVKAIGYKNLFARLRAGEREDPSVRSFFYPEINIGVGMIVMRAMMDRGIRIMVVTKGISSGELQEMGFDHAEDLESAVSILHQRQPRAEVASALNAKVIVSLSKA